MTPRFIFPDPQEREWHVSITCDGVPLDYRVRRRRGEEHSDDGVRAVESFQFWNDATLVSEVIFPAVRSDRNNENAILGMLNKVLNCSIATVEGEEDPIEALFRKLD